MKVLTIKQPWATLIMQKDKRFEFRSWQTKYRGDLLIHAGKGLDKEAMKRLEKYIPSDMPTGKIKDIYTKSSFKENYGWQMENVEVFEKPIEAKGKLSLWEYEVEDEKNS